jgi:hypothetical protein
MDHRYCSCFEYRYFPSLAVAQRAPGGWSRGGEVSLFLIFFIFIFIPMPHLSFLIPPHGKMRQESREVGMKMKMKKKRKRPSA